MITDDFELFEKRKVLSELDLLFENSTIIGPNPDSLSKIPEPRKI